MARQAPHSNRLKGAVALSIAAHVTLVAVLFYFNAGHRDPDIERAAGNPGSLGVVQVNLITATPSGHLQSTSNLQSTKKWPTANSLTGYGSQEPGDGGASTTLQKIRDKIERVKFYPLAAKRSRVEGAPQVQFKIKSDGSLEYVQLAQSSGHFLLDEAATTAVKNGAPYPFYAETISLNILYSLTH